MLFAILFVFHDAGLARWATKRSASTFRKIEIKMVMWMFKWILRFASCWLKLAMILCTTNCLASYIDITLKQQQVAESIRGGIEGLALFCEKALNVANDAALRAALERFQADLVAFDNMVKLTFEDASDNHQHGPHDSQ